MTVWALAAEKKATAATMAEVEKYIMSRILYTDFFFDCRSLSVVLKLVPDED
jgi:hypothetical protein